MKEKIQKPTMLQGEEYANLLRDLIFFKYFKCNCDFNF